MNKTILIDEANIKSNVQPEHILLEGFVKSLQKEMGNNLKILSNQITPYDLSSLCEEFLRKTNGEKGEAAIAYGTYGSSIGIAIGVDPAILLGGIPGIDLNVTGTLSFSKSKEALFIVHNNMLSHNISNNQIKKPVCFLTMRGKSTSVGLTFEASASIGTGNSTFNEYFALGPFAIRLAGASIALNKTGSWYSLKDQIEGFLTEIADIAISPLQAHIINGWNFHIPNQQKTIQIGISLNPDFFLAHKKTAQVVAKKDAFGSKIHISTEQGSHSISTVPQGWTVESSNNAIQPAGNDEITIGHETKLTLSITYTPPEDHFGLSFLKVKFDNFKVRHKVKNLVDTSDVIDFELKLPIYIGPLRVNKNSLTIGSADNAAGLEVYSKKENSPTLIVKDGKVGIGISQPKRDLHVNGDYYGKGHIYYHAYEGDRENGTAYIQARDDSGLNGTNIAMQFRTQKDGTIKEAMRLSEEGKVGIGTTEPEATLDVRGDLKVTGPSTLDGNLKVSGNIHSNNKPVIVGEEEENLRIIRGRIYGDDILIGVKLFAIAKTVQGNFGNSPGGDNDMLFKEYTIRFTSNFTKIPVITATLSHLGPLYANISVSDYSSNNIIKVRIVWKKPSNIEKHGFDFIAIGPR